MRNIICVFFHSIIAIPWYCSIFLRGASYLLCTKFSVQLIGCLLLCTIRDVAWIRYTLCMITTCASIILSFYYSERTEKYTRLTHQIHLRRKIANTCPYIRICVLFDVKSNKKKNIHLWILFFGYLKFWNNVIVRAEILPFTSWIIFEVDFWDKIKDSLPSSID